MARTALLARPMAEPDSDLLAAGIAVADALAGCDERQLLTHARRGMRDPDVVHGPPADRLPTAMALALLRSLRTLRAVEASPRSVGELPFTHVHGAVRCCITLGRGDRDASLRDWVRDIGLRRWAVDEPAWERRLRLARRSRRLLAFDQAINLGRGRQIAGVARTSVVGGPIDGADAIALVLDDATVLFVPDRDDIACPERLVSGRVQGAFYDRDEGVVVHVRDRPVTVPTGPSVLWQPSPTAA